MLSVMDTLFNVATDYSTSTCTSKIPSVAHSHLQQASHFSEDLHLKQNTPEYCPNNNLI